MARILAVGIATLDIVNEVVCYPPEDAEVRAVGQSIRRGGNATNTLVVLSQLGHQCAWAGTLADEPDARTVLADLERHAIDTTAVTLLPEGKVPTSYITLSRASGSRTIVHYRNLPEYRFEHFAELDLAAWNWLHFEGRNLDEVEAMLRWARRTRPELPVSLEVEKPREGIERLFPAADLLLFSHAYARHHGYTDAAALLHGVRPRAPQATLVCAWGADGAAALAPGGEVIHEPAASPPTVVDTLGAGDVFNAGMIDGLVTEVPLAEALAAAVRLAGRKCGQAGLEGLGAG